MTATLSLRRRAKAIAVGDLPRVATFFSRAAGVGVRTPDAPVLVRSALSIIGSTRCHLPRARDLHERRA